MRRHQNWPGSVIQAAFIIVLLVLPVIGCSQASAPSSSSSSQAAKPGAPENTKPIANESKPSQATNKEQPASKQEKKLVKLTVPYNAVAATHTILWVAKEKGIFEKYGLDVDIPYIASSTTQVQAMVSGEVKLAHVGGNAVVAANLAGADLVIIAGTSNTLGFSLYASPDIKRVEDLKGKAVGVSRFGSSTDFGARWVIRHFGMEPEKDVTILQTGGSPESVAAVQSGRVQAAVFGPPSTLNAKKLGLHEVANMPQLGVAYPTATIAVSKKFLAENTETVKSFLKAFMEGIAVGKREKEFSMNVIGKYTKTEDREVLDETYEFYMNGMFAKVPYATTDAIQAILNEMAQENPKAKDAKAEDFLDMSLVKEIEASGFVNSLYKN